MSVKLVEVHSFLNPIDANMAKHVLDLEGIDSVLHDEQINSLGFYNLATGGVKLLVRDKDYHTAKRLIQDALANIQSHESEEGEWDAEEEAYLAEEAHIKEKNDQTIQNGFKYALIGAGLVLAAMYLYLQML